MEKKVLWLGREEKKIERGVIIVSPKVLLCSASTWCTHSLRLFIHNTLFHTHTKKSNISHSYRLSPLSTFCRLHTHTQNTKMVRGMSALSIKALFVLLLLCVGGVLAQTKSVTAIVDEDDKAQNVTKVDKADVPKKPVVVEDDMVDPEIASRTTEEQESWVVAGVKHKVDDTKPADVKPAVQPHDPYSRSSAIKHPLPPPPSVPSIPRSAPESTNIQFDGPPPGFDGLQWSQMTAQEKRVALAASQENKKARVELDNVRNTLDDLNREVHSPDHPAVVQARKDAIDSIKEVEQAVHEIKDTIAGIKHHKKQAVANHEQDMKKEEKAKYDAKEEQKQKVLDAKQKQEADAKAKKADELRYKKVNEQSFKDKKELDNIAEKEANLRATEAKVKSDAADLKARQDRAKNDIDMAGTNVESEIQQIKENAHMQTLKAADERANVIIKHRSTMADKNAKEETEKQSEKEKIATDVVAEQARKEERAKRAEERQAESRLQHADEAANEQDRKKNAAAAAEREKKLTEAAHEKALKEQSAKSSEQQSKLDEVKKNSQEEINKAAAQKDAAIVDKEKRETELGEEQMKSQAASGDRAKAEQAREEDHKLNEILKDAELKKQKEAESAAFSEAAVKKAVEEGSKKKSYEEEASKEKEASDKLREDAHKATEYAKARAAEKVEGAKAKEQETKAEKEEKLKKMEAERNVRYQYSEGQRLLKEADRAMAAADKLRVKSDEAMEAYEKNSEAATVAARASLLAVAAKSARAYAEAAQFTSDKASGAVEKLLSSQISAKALQYKEIEDQVDEDLSLAKALQKKADEMYGAIKEEAAAREKEVKAAYDTVDDFESRQRAEQETKRKAAKAAQELASARLQEYLTLTSDVNVERVALRSANSSLADAKNAATEAVTQAEKDNTADSYKIAMDTAKYVIEYAKRFQARATGALNTVDKLIAVASVTNDTSLINTSYKTRREFESIESEAKGIVAPAESDYAETKDLYEKSRAKELADRAQEQGEKKEAAAAEAARRQKLEANFFGAIPKRLVLNDGVTPWGPWWRIPQYASTGSGELCSLAGLPRVGRSDGKIGSFPVDVCQPGSTAKYLVPHGWNGESILSISKSGDVSIQGQSKWAVTLDGSMFVSAQANASNITLETGYAPAQEGLADPSYSLYEGLCVLSGAFLSNIQTVSNQSLPAAFTLPPQCRPLHPVSNLLFIDANGTVTPTKNQGPTYLDGYTITTSGVYTPIKLASDWRADYDVAKQPAYSKHGSICVLHGEMTGSPNVTAAVLPTECRPMSGSQRFRVYKGGEGYNVQIGRNGFVKLLPFSSNPKTTLSLEGIKFFVSPVAAWEDAERKKMVWERRDRIRKARKAEQSAKAAAQEEQVKKTASLATPTQIVPIEPFDEFGRDFRLPQFARKEGTCFVSGLVENPTVESGVEIKDKVMATLPSVCQSQDPEVFLAHTDKGESILLTTVKESIIYTGNKRGPFTSLQVNFDKEKDTLPLAGGWNKVDGYAAPAVAKNGNVCSLSGVVLGGLVWSNPLATVPTECRPKNRVVLPVASFDVGENHATQRIVIEKNGEVHVDSKVIKGEPLLSLSGATYSVGAGEALTLTTDAQAVSGDYRKAAIATNGHICSLQGVITVSKAGFVTTVPESCRPSYSVTFTTTSVALDDKSKDSKAEVVSVVVDFKGRVYVGAPATITLDRLSYMNVEATAWEKEQAIAVADEQEKERQDIEQARRAIAERRLGEMAGTQLVVNDGWDSKSNLNRVPQYSRFGGICLLSGSLTTSNMQTVAMTLPDNCRPISRTIFDMHGASDIDTTRIDIEANGQVRYAGGATGKNLPLDGIVFGTADATASAVLDLNDKYVAYGSVYGNSVNVSSDAGFCAVNGLVKLADVNDSFNGTIATLPSECRPARTLSFNANHHEFTHKVRVLPSGEIQWVEGDKTRQWLSLSNIRFFNSTTPSKPLQLASAFKATADAPATITRVDNLCVLGGTISGKGATLVATLPAECRPESGAVVSAVNAGKHAELLEILPNGQLHWRAHYVDQEATFSLDGISVMGNDVSAWEKVAIKAVSERMAREAKDEVAKRHEAALSKPITLSSGVRPSGVNARIPQYARYGDICVLSGVLYGSDMNQKDIAKLPADCRPANRGIFNVVLDTSKTVRIDVLPDGRLVVVEGAPSGAIELSLSGVTFPISGADSSVSLRLNDAWQAYGDVYGPFPKVVKDKDLCVVNALVKLTDEKKWVNTIGSLPAFCRPSQMLTFGVNQHDRTHELAVYPDGTITWVGGEKRRTWISLSNIVFSTGSSQQVSLQNDAQPISGMAPLTLSKSEFACVLSGSVNIRSLSDRKIATLPSGCRPTSGSVHLGGVNSEGGVYFAVDDVGTVIVPGKFTGKVSFSGAIFVAAPVPQWEVQRQKEVSAAEKRRQEEEQAFKKDAEEKAKKEAEQREKAAKKAEQAAKKAAEQAQKVELQIPLTKTFAAYGHGYTIPQWYKEGSVCVFEGVGWAGDIRQQIANMPAKCKPDKRLALGTAVGSGTPMRMDILSNGTLMYTNGAGDLHSTWVSFSSLVTPTETSQPMSIALNGNYFMNNGGEYGPASVTKSGDLCVLSGMVKVKNGWSNFIGTVPSGCIPKDGHLQFPSNRGERSAPIYIYKNGQIYTNRANGETTVSLDGIAYFAESSSNTLKLANGWNRYHGDWRAPAFKKQNNLCVLTGSISTGNNVYGIVSRLPEECRPKHKLIQWTGNAQYIERIDILPDGRIMYVDGPRAHNRLSLDGITIVVDRVTMPPPVVEKNPVTQLQMKLADGWKDIPATDDYKGAEFAIYGDFCMLSGMATSENMHTTVAIVPEACRPANGRLVFGRYLSNSVSVRYDITPAGEIKYVTGETVGGWLPFDGMLYARKGAMVHSLPLSSGYVEFGRNGYAPPSYKVQDGLCVLQGTARRDNWGNFPSSGTLGYLPADCRPHDGRVLYGTMKNERKVRFDILPSGQMWFHCHDGTPRTIMDLSGIHFFTESFNSIQLTNGWYPYGGYRTPSWRLTDKICVLSGLCNGNAGSAVAMLPLECRPRKRLVFHTSQEDGAARVDVLSDGRVMYVSNRKYSWLSLDGIAFVADAPQIASVEPYPVDKIGAVYGLRMPTGFSAAEGYEAPSWWSAGPMCGLQGAIDADDMRATIAVFPEKCRPTGRTTFEIDTRNKLVRLDVLEDGSVQYASGEVSNGVLPLNGVTFPNKDARRTQVNLLGRWVNYGGDHAKASFIKYGSMCFFTGTIRTDNHEMNQWVDHMATLPEECQPEAHIIVHLLNGAHSLRFNINPEGLLYFVAPGRYVKWLSLANIAFFKRATAVIDLAPGWSRHSSSYRAPSYHKEGNICMLGGLINGNGARLMGTLPKECWPESTLSFSVNHHDRMNYILITNEGKIEYPSGQRRHSWVSFEGIHYYVKSFTKPDVEGADVPQMENGKALKLLHGAKPYGEGFQAPSYVVSNGLCVLSGKIMASDHRIVYTVLPEECRPERRHSFALYSGHIMRIDVTAEGEVKFINSYDRTNYLEWVDLSSIAFPVKATKEFHLELLGYMVSYDTTFAEASYSLVNDLCVISGFILDKRFSSVPQGTKIARLPDACRVDRYKAFAQTNSQGLNSVLLTADGYIQTWGNNGHNSQPFLSLSGIVFHPKVGTNVNLRNGWSAYGYGWKEPTFKVTKGLCLLSGLVRGSRVGLVAQLPGSCRPSAGQSFHTSNHNYPIRLDVFADGRVYMPWGNHHGWISLDGIKFVTDGGDGDANVVVKDAPVQSKALALNAGVSGHGDGFGAPLYHKWGALCFASGLAKVENGQLQRTYAVLPEECRPAGQIAINQNTFMNGDVDSFRADINVNGVIRFRNGASNAGILSFNPFFFPVKAASLMPIELNDRWTGYGHGFQEPSWMKQGDYCVLTGALEGPMHKGSMSTHLATLPAECRPDGRVIMAANTGRDQIRVDVLADGRIIIVNNPDTRSGIVSLDGLAFMTGAHKPFQLKNGWRDYTGEYRRSGYKVQGDVCTLSGLLRGWYGRDIGRLPEECRPVNREVFYVNYERTNVRVDITQEGHMMVVSSKSTSWLPLDMIRFLRQKK